jgi:hypothetical protein
MGIFLYIIFCPISIVQYGPRGVNVSQSELYLFRLGHQVICVFAMCENRTYMYLPNACFHRIAQ